MVVNFLDITKNYAKIKEEEKYKSCISINHHISTCRVNHFIANMFKKMFYADILP